MGKASRSKRRASVSSVRRTRTNTGWYVITAIVVVLGVGLIFLTRGGDDGPGPQLGEHWHAALGVYDCDHWMSDGTGEGLWTWPFTTAQGSPGRPDGTYAGLHSHADGLIHMEPVASDETGKHATIGTYFEFGGWKLSETSVTFLDTTRKNGDDCNGKAGEWHWMVNGKLKTGNPANFVLSDGDVISIVFVNDDTGPLTLKDPPSDANLANPSEMGPNGQTVPDTNTSGATTTTGAGGSTTTAPTAESTTSAPTSAP